MKVGKVSSPKRSVIPAAVAHSENVDIHTPPYIFVGIPLTFDLDPASPLSGPVTPARCHYTVQQDGLAQPWFGTVWLNPPYNRWQIGKWIAKLAEHGSGVALVYVRRKPTKSSGAVTAGRPGRCATRV